MNKRAQRLKARRLAEKKIMDYQVKDVMEAKYRNNLIINHNCNLSDDKARLIAVLVVYIVFIMCSVFI